MNVLGIIAAAAVFFGIVILYANEIGYLGLYFRPGALLLSSLAFGAALGIVLALLFRGPRQQEPVDRIRRAAILFFTCLILSPLLLSLANRWFGKRENTAVPVVFESEDARYSSRFGVMKEEGGIPQPNAYFLYFYHQDQLMRITSPEALFPGAEEGDTIEIPVREGAFGYDWVALPGK
jgi:hypothetical protein